MKAKAGILLMVLGSVLVASALGLFLYNSEEQAQASDAVEILMPQMVEAIQNRQETSPADPSADPSEDALETPAADAADDRPEILVTQPQKKYMPVVEIDGHNYIGFVGIHSLGLELPVMAEWSYSKLKLSPCRFTGDMYCDDLVVMAHNYDSHFGHLKELRVGDRVTFTDMDGVTVEYEVVALDVLGPNAVEEMVAGEYDLTLFTCTYGGQNRVTVRCDRVNS